MTTILTWVAVGAVVVLAAVAARVIYARLNRYDRLRHFGTVTEGVLYRCGQPRVSDLEKLRASLGVKTVVALRAGIDNPKRNAWAEPERRFCADNDVHFVSLPSNHKNPPTSEQVREFLRVVGDPARRPVLVHCKRGQQRTGLLCALYRMTYEGWTKEQAMAEMDALGFGLRKRRHRLLRQVIDEFSPEALQAGNADSPPQRGKVALAGA